MKWGKEWVRDRVKTPQRDSNLGRSARNTVDRQEARWGRERGREWEKSPGFELETPEAQRRYLSRRYLQGYHLSSSVVQSV